MQDFIIVTGMVLKTAPVGEYDRRVTILTKERGKISAFAKGARRVSSSFLAATNPFSFGQFKLFEGRSSYNIMECSISNYFADLREDFEGAFYGMYFLELADYYTRENNDDKEMLKLLYQSIRALLLPSLPDRLVRYIYELKAMTVQGEFPGPPAGKNYHESTLYTIQYIVSSSIEGLYSFNVSDEVLGQLEQIASACREKVFDRKFKSLEILESIC